MSERSGDGGRLAVVKARRLLICAALICMASLTAAPTAAQAKTTLPRAKQSSSTTVTVRWHKVATSLGNLFAPVVLAAGNHDVAVSTSGGGIALIDTTTNQRRAITPPFCTYDDAEFPTTATFGTAAFGGPWFGIGCVVPTTTASGASVTVTYADLLNLKTGVWTARVLDPSVCVAEGVACNFDSVGSTWIRFTGSDRALTAAGVTSEPTYLENIATGAVQNGAFSTGGPITPDDLNNATGVVHPCTGSAPALNEDSFGTPQTDSADPHFAQLGRFILRTGTSEEKNPQNILQACDSKTRIVIPQGFVATTDLVFWTRSSSQPGPSSQFGNLSQPDPLVGLSLPALRSLLITNNKGPLVAASNTTLYETTTDSSSSTTLWAGIVPKTSLTGR